MIRRINIAMAAQPAVSRFGGQRASVNFNPADMNRNAAIQKQKNALQAARQRQAQQRQSQSQRRTQARRQVQAPRQSNLNVARQHREAFGN